jgi:hypothetical protein
MFKFLFILALGIAIGYGYGWKDAQVNEKNVAERFVDQIGGANKDNMRSDTDAKMRAVEGK